MQEVDWQVNQVDIEEIGGLEEQFLILEVEYDDIQHHFQTDHQNHHYVDGLETS